VPLFEESRSGKPGSDDHRAQVLRDTGIDAVSLKTRGTEITAAQELQLVRNIVTLLDERGLGFEAGMRTRITTHGVPTAPSPRNYSPPGRRSRTSPTEWATPAPRASPTRPNNGAAFHRAASPALLPTATAPAC